MIQRMFVTLDTKKTNYKNVGKINHGDDLILELTVLSDGDMISFNDPMVDLLVKKSDGKMIRQNSGIEHIKPNKFVIEVMKDCVTSPGLSTNQLIINDNGRISTCMFYYTILNSLEEDIIQSISNVEVLEQLDEYVIEARERMELLNNDINKLEEFFGATSDTLVEAEMARNEAEQNRIHSEILRVNNENDRIEADNIRNQNESIRNQNEVDRSSSELVREQRESERILNEEERLQNESERMIDESTRQQNENTRQSNESIRMSNETDRKTQENRRATAETNRVNAETTRRNNENSRISNETERQKAMNEMKSLIDDVYGFDERIRVIEDEIEETNSSLDNIIHVITPNMSTSEIQNILNKTGDIKFKSGVYNLDYNIVNESTSANGVRKVGLYLDIKSNTRICFEKNVTINIKECELDWYRIFRIYNQENVEIHGGIINGDRATHVQQIKDGQWGYGIFITKSKNITIKNVVLNDCYGDGICVGNSENVLIHKCISNNNRRQALTIGNGENITVDNCKFLNTNGQAPQAGIDIEPDLATQKVKNIVIKNCVIDGNNGSGIELNLSKLNVESQQDVHTVSVFIDNCKISNNKDGVMYTYLPDNKDLLNNVNGFIKVTNSHIFENTRGCVLLLNILDKKMPTLICDNLHLSKWVSFGIGFQRYSLDDGASENNIVEYGGCYFSNISFFDCPNTSDYDCPIYIQPYDYVKFNSIFKDINIIDNIARNRWCVWKEGEGYINYINNDKTIEINNSISYARLNGLEVKFNNGSTFALPSPEYLKGREFTFINNKNGEGFTLKTEENTQFDDTFVEGLNVVVKGNSSYLKIRSNSSNTWQTVEKIGKVLPSGFTSEKKILFGGGSPTSGTWEKGDKIYNTNPTSKAVEYWICMESGTPGTWAYGGVCDLKKMDAISDSTATSIDGINTKFNTLLSRLRTSGLLRE